MLVFLIDSTSDNILDDYRVLRRELDKHNKKLNKLPSILLLSKDDISVSKTHSGQILPTGIDIIRISSLNRKNLEKSIKKIAYLIAD
jgi:GTPase involved in cell partitioning and DNA repair